MKIWLILTFSLLLPLQAHSACRQALALGLDVSGSVDASEYQLQLHGVAQALSSDAVKDVLFRHGSAPVRVSVFEWSGPNDQTIILPWTELNTPNDLETAVSSLRLFQRTAKSPTTAIGSAMRFGEQLLASQPTCWRHTLDLSGDGEANTGPRPQFVSFSTDTMTINGLVIGSGDAHSSDQRAAEIKALAAYFQSYVVRGPGAFVETAIGFENYAEAMERKLIRELQSIAIGSLHIE